MATKPLNTDFKSLLDEEKAFDEGVKASNPTINTDSINSDLSHSLQLAQSNLQNADIAAAHRISDANASRILANSAPLTAFKVVQGMSASVDNASDMVAAFLPGIPIVGLEMKTAMAETKTNRSFLEVALGSGDHNMLAGS